MTIFGVRIVGRNLALAAVFLALVIVQVVPRSSGLPEREIVRLAPRLVPAAASEVRFAGPAARGSSEPRAVTLQRRGEGDERAGAWGVEELFGYPADDVLLEQVLERLAGLTTLDLLAEDAERHGEYGLEEGQAQRCTVRDRGGATLADLFIGQSTQGSTFVRVVGDERVYGAPALPPCPADENGWARRRSLLGVDLILVASIQLEGTGVLAATGEPVLLLQRDTASVNGWLDAAGMGVPPATVARLWSELSGLFPARILSGDASTDHGLDEPRWRFTVTLHGSTTDDRAVSGPGDGAGGAPQVVLEVGNGVEGRLTAARSSGGDWVVGIEESAVQRIGACVGALRAR